MPIPMFAWLPARRGARHGDAQAVKLLSEALRSDVDADVRLAAAKALGETKNPAAVAALGEALTDADPAMQYRAVLSLKKVTGKDLGNDVDRWQQYVKGEQPEPTPVAGRAYPPPVLTGRLRLDRRHKTCLRCRCLRTRKAVV